jgi:hypothetical protein
MTDFKSNLEVNRNQLIRDSLFFLLSQMTSAKRRLSMEQELNMLPERTAEAHVKNFNDFWLKDIMGGDENYFSHATYYDFNKITLERYIEINPNFKLFPNKIKKFQDFFKTDELDNLAFGLCQVNLLTICAALEKNEVLRRMFKLKKSFFGGWSRI